MGEGAECMGEGIDAQRHVLSEWLWSEEGQALIRGQLRRRRLPDDAATVGSVAHDVALRVLRRLDSSGPIEATGTGTRAPTDTGTRIRTGGEAGTGTAVSAVVPYAVRCVINATNDLCRARARSLEDLVDEGGPEPTSGPDPVGEAVVDGSDAIVDEVRLAVHATVVPGDVWVPAAALSVVTMSQGEVDAEVAGPPPQNGDLTGYWVGLRLAGRDDCFERPDTTAIRNRRARAITRVRARLTQAYGTVAGAVAR